MEFLATGPFWILVALVIFIGILVYMKVPGMLATQLDNHGAAIANELETARRLREEAQALLASYKKRQEEAMQEADAIIAQALVEAQKLAEETHEAMIVQVARRQQIAEDKIHQAEIQAVAEVRAAAADIAINAATKVIADKVDAAKDSSLIEKSISELASKLH
ncbi:MAG: ATP F0F1 synthase subunit B [Parvibaculaceae bacterium]